MHGQRNMKSPKIVEYLQVLINCYECVGKLYKYYVTFITNKTAIKNFYFLVRNAILTARK